MLKALFVLAEGSKIGAALKNRGPFEVQVFFQNQSWKSMVTEIFVESEQWFVLTMIDVSYRFSE